LTLKVELLLGRRLDIGNLGIDVVRKSQHFPSHKAEYADHCEKQYHEETEHQADAT
jgi:hypothetical protein